MSGGFYWIVSYPKSGNTWLRLALQALLHPAPDFHPDNRFAPNASHRGEIEDALDIPSGDLTPQELEALRPTAYRTMAARAKEPMFRKAHDAWVRTSDGTPLFPPDITLGTLYLVRDPRDVAVSWAHFAGIGLDEAVHLLCQTNAVLTGASGRPPLNLPQRLLCWSGHVRSWTTAPGREPCVLRYEDMLAAPIDAIQQAAAYAGISNTSHQLAKAVATTRFEVLRDAEAKHGFDGGQIRGASFFRSGRAGGWRDSLSASQSARIAQTHAAVMEEFGYL